MRRVSGNEWLARHNAAWCAPHNGYEYAIVYALKAAQHYILAYNRSYCENLERPSDDGVATDGVLSAGVRSILDGVLVLLDGELGRLDGGMCWDEVDRLCRLAGWKDVDDMRSER